MAAGVHRVWTHVRRALRPTNGKPRQGTPPVNGKQLPTSLGRASLADAFRRDRERLAWLVRRFIVEPYARRRRRRIAIAELSRLDDHLLADIGLTRGQIELAVDGPLAQRAQTAARPAEAFVPAEQERYELPRAA
jgi:uncharacterized protein YjiS (DUF1127 family)